MKNTISILILLMIATLWGCESDPNSRLVEGKIVDKIYIAERFDMKVNLPKGWQLMSKLLENKLKEIGGEEIEKEFGDNRSNRWTTLLHLQKVGLSLNTLMISYLVYQPEIHGDSYTRSKETRFLGMKKILENNPGVKVEDSRALMDIGGVEFDAYNMLIRKEEEIKGYQILLEKKYDNNEVLLFIITTEDREALEELRVVIESIEMGRKN